eukprot:341961_1
MAGDFDYEDFRRHWNNLLEREKYKEAEELCHKNLHHDKLTSDQSKGLLYRHLGYLYEHYLGDKTFDDVLEQYLLSLQADESNSDSHYNLGNLFLEQAKRRISRALELDPNHQKAHEHYTTLSEVVICYADWALDFYPCTNICHTQIKT